MAAPRRLRQLRRGLPRAPSSSKLSHLRMPSDFPASRILPAAPDRGFDRPDGGFRVPAELMLGQVDQFAVEARMFGGTDRENQRAVAILGHVCVSHGAVDVDALAG